MNAEKVKSLLQIGQKGRLLHIGKLSVSVLIKRKRAALVLLASDASEKLKHEIEWECRRNNIPIYIFSSKDELGKVCNRETVAVIGISDKNLAKGIKTHLF